ncbi:MAG: hypothetical protein NT126_01175 [Bacteroidetes bacterium]|nr:hypothetical protein [Bacteroidota bacterium]
MNKKIIPALLFCAALFVISCKNSENKTDAANTDTTKTTASAPQDTTAHKAAYACPMHPEETSDKPAKCPKCGMDLEAKS